MALTAAVQPLFILADPGPPEPFLRVPITGERRAAVVEFCGKQMGGDKIDFSRFTLEKELREVLHLILSAPEYQLS